MTDYVPKPIDTTSVTLTPDQQALVDSLAENAHSVWAETRIAEGWRHGPRREDDEKTHPMLVSFEALPESEKDVDRVMVEQVVKAALALGYRIEKC